MGEQWDMVERLTGLSGFGMYMNKVLTIDAVFLNEDRHTHNIAVLMKNTGEFAFCPIFDHGAGLLSDTTMDYPLGGEIYTLIDQVQSKTFSSSFDEQLEISEELYGNNITFHFTKKDVREVLAAADIWEKPVVSRVETILYEQMRRYPYLFK